MKSALRRILTGGFRTPPWELPERRQGQRYLVLVRHGQATAGWGDDLDPPLSDRGRAEAEAMALEVATFGPLPLVVSPMRRTRETASAIEARLHVTPRLEPAVGEIPAPLGVSTLAERASWLQAAMEGRWPDLGPEHQQWRADLLAALRAMTADAIVVTHFVAINVAVGEAVGDNRVKLFSPGLCSRTVVRLGTDGRLDVVRWGPSDGAEIL